MAVLSLDFSKDPQLKLPEDSLETVADRLETTAKVIFKDIKLIHSFTINEDLVRIYSLSGGSVVNLRVYNTGTISFTIDYAPDSIACLNEVLRVEKELNKKYGRCVSAKSLPNIRATQPFRYTQTSDRRLLEYDIDEVVFSQVTPFQKIEIYHSIQLGNILVLDDLQNLSEADIAYTEALMQRGKESYRGKDVLILGGGDGALLYELLKEDPKEVIMLEIDDVVMKVCAKHMRSACGTVLDNYDGPNYKIIVGDCMETMTTYLEEGRKFDYIFGDLTDVPISLDESKELWTFIEQVLKQSFAILKPDGKFMTHVTGVSTPAALDAYQQQLKKLTPPVEFTVTSAFVPSFYEEWIFCQVAFARE